MGLARRHSGWSWIPKAVWGFRGLWKWLALETRFLPPKVTRQSEGLLMTLHHAWVSPFCWSTMHEDQAVLLFPCGFHLSKWWRNTGVRVCQTPCLKTTWKPQPGPNLHPPLHLPPSANTAMLFWHIGICHHERYLTSVAHHSPSF